jgi:IS1 family transposase
MLIEGNSISSTARFTGVHRDTCCRLLVRFGTACQKFLDREMQDLQLTHLEVDEMWTFVRKKQKRITGEEPDAGKIGDIYIFVAFDEATRLIPAYRVDRRNFEATAAFMDDLANRLKRPKPHASDSHAYNEGKYTPIIRISTDAFESYAEAVDMAFGPYAEYAQIRKRFDSEGAHIDKKILRGNIEPKAVSTSLVERSNLTTRTFMRRCMRRTMGFSKKLENLQAAAATHVAYYNYCWCPKTIKTTPAVKAGIAPKRMTFDQLYQLLRECYPEFFFGDKCITAS